MKKVRNILIVLLALIIGLGVFLYLFRNAIAKRAIEYYSREEIGIEVKVDKVNIDIWNTTFSLEQFRIMNPAGFEYEHIAQLNNVHLDYELNSVFNPPVRAEYLEVDIEEIVIARNADGKFNVKEIVPEMPPTERKDVSDEKAPPETIEDPDEVIEDEFEFHIDKFVLSIDRLVYIDDYKRDKSRVRNISIGMKKHVYENITSLEELARLILVEALLQAGLSNLEEIIGPLMDKLNDYISRLPRDFQLDYEDKLHDQIRRIDDFSREYRETIQQYIERVPEISLDDLKPEYEERFREELERIEEKREEYEDVIQEQEERVRDRIDRIEERAEEYQEEIRERYQDRIPDDINDSLRRILPGR